MATKVKPSRIHATGTPQNGQVLSYVSPDTFHWTNGGGGGGGDMYYNNFNWVTKTGNSFDLDLSSKYVPTGDFTVNAPATIKEGQTYLLRVENGATAYTMTLGNGITNLQGTNITLTPNAIDMFVFLATKDGNDPVTLELQKEINTSSGGGIYSFYLDDETDQTELDNLWAWYNTLPSDTNEFDNSVIMIEYGNGSGQYPYYAPSGRYYYKTQDSQDMYFFGDNYILKIQFTMQGWYTRVGIYSVTIYPTYTAGTGLALNGNTFSNTGVTSVNGSTGDVTGLQTTSNLKTGLTDNSDTYYPSQKAVKTAVDAKQDTLVSGTNIKTINGTSVLGTGDITVGGDVQVSSQANNILTSGTKLRAGTQANYEALGSYDSNTIYLTY